MSNEKNSVGTAVVTIMSNVLRKYEAEKQAFEKSEAFTSGEYTLSSFNDDFQLRIAKSAQKIVESVEKAINWSGVRDSLSDRLKRVYTSTVTKQDKTPKIIKELYGLYDEKSLVWLFMDTIVINLKSTSTANIEEIDLDF